MQEAAQIETGQAEVVLDHDDYPNLRFRVVLSPEGVVTAFLVADRRHLRIEGVEFEEDDPRWGPPVQITRRALAELPFGEMERAARAKVNLDRAALARGEYDLPGDDAWALQLEPMTSTSRPRGGRAPLTDGFLAKVARDYARLATDNPDPIKRLASERNVPKNTLKNWVREARRRELLSDPPATQGPIGTAGGQVTEKARRILEQEKGQP